MPLPMVIIPMVVVSMSSLVKKEKDLGNMHNKNIQRDYYTYHLFCLIYTFVKHLNR